MVTVIALRVALTGTHDAAQAWDPMRPSLSRTFMGLIGQP